MTKLKISQDSGLISELVVNYERLVKLFNQVRFVQLFTCELPFHE